MIAIAPDFTRQPARLSATPRERNRLRKLRSRQMPAKPAAPRLPEGMARRGGMYYSDFRWNGRRFRKRLSSDLKTAKELLTQLKARAQRADVGLLDNAASLVELRAGFIRHCRLALRPASVARYEAALDAILPALPAKASHLSGVTIDRYREQRLAGRVSPRTVNIEVGALRTMLRWAVRQRLIGSNSIADVRPLKHDHAKQGRALTDDEVSRLLAASPQPWRDIWYGFLVTGLRKNELASLTFSDIDWENRELVVRASVAKNGRERRIPVEAGLWDILCRQRDQAPHRLPGQGKTPAITAKVQRLFTRDHVFVTSQNTPLTHRSGLYHAFMRCCLLAGIDVQDRGDGHVDLHSTRRTFATSLIVGLADPKSVQDLLGHSTLDMTMRLYAKVHRQDKRAAIGRLSYGAGAGQASMELVQCPRSGVPRMSASCLDAPGVTM